MCVCIICWMGWVLDGRVSLTPDARDCLQLARTLFLEYFTTRLRMMDKKKCTALRLTIVPSSIILEIDVVWRNGRFYAAKTSKRRLCMYRLFEICHPNTEGCAKLPLTTAAETWTRVDALLL